MKTAMTAMLTLAVGLTLAAGPAGASTASPVHADRQTATIATPNASQSLKGAGKPAPQPRPGIVLLRPRLSGLSAGPIDIEMKFTAPAGAKINIKSLRVLYGWFGIDVTSQLLEKATVTPEGLIAKGAELPTGHHTVTVEVRDSRDRVATKTFEFEISEPDSDHGK
jgi:hypothetical protein